VAVTPIKASFIVRVEGLEGHCSVNSAAEVSVQQILSWRHREIIPVCRNLHRERVDKIVAHHTHHFFLAFSSCHRKEK
jgi:hypothetical protein